MALNRTQANNAGKNNMKQHIYILCKNNGDADLEKSMTNELLYI